MNRKRCRPDPDEDGYGVDKRFKEHHIATFPPIKKHNVYSSFTSLIFRCKDPTIHSPGFVLVTIEGHSYVFPVSMLLDPACNTRPATLCDIMTYSCTEQVVQHGYFNSNGRITCRPIEEEMEVTKAYIRAIQCEYIQGVERRVCCATQDVEYGDIVLVLSIELPSHIPMTSNMHMFYIPFRAFLDPSVWPSAYGKCFLPFQRSL